MLGIGVMRITITAGEARKQAGKCRHAVNTTRFRNKQMVSTANDESETAIETAHDKCCCWQFYRS